MLLARQLARTIRTGQLCLVDANGRLHRFGDDCAPEVIVRLHDRALHWKLLFRPDYQTAEAYTRGTLTIECGSLYDFLDVLGRNMAGRSPGLLRSLFTRAERLFRSLLQYNSLDRARLNAAYHYDRMSGLYDLFLDVDRQYSCAYFVNDFDTLDMAQEQKRRRIAAKLLVRPEQQVLDIGSGWGGLGLYLANRLGVRVTGLTLSEEQLRLSRARAGHAGLSDRVEFVLRDYREETQTYDRIVSVGMFEHVGLGHFRSFFRALNDRLAPDGVALIHTVGRAGGPGVTRPWVRRNVLPGGYAPALSEIIPQIERAGLLITDIEVWRLHYAETLRRWRERLVANRDRAVALHGERTYRMWEYYLASSEIAFRYFDHLVFQIQLTKRMDAVPLNRDYVQETERLLAAADRRQEQSERAA